jgi:Holliday junction DNA helicase RuvB
MIERQEEQKKVIAQDTPIDAEELVEREFDDALRPQTFTDYIGQEQLKKTLQLSMSAAKGRGEPVDHVLLYGPPGLGKTTLAHVIANEMGKTIKITSGPAIERAGDLASLLTNLEEGDILFIDEIHRLPRTVEEILYPAMEDYVIDIMLGKGPSAQSLRLDLPKFTMVGATTRYGALGGPLRDRFGIVGKLEFYSPEEIAQILTRTAKLLKLPVEKTAINEMAARTRLTPRIANRLIKRVRDWAQVHGNGTIDAEALSQTLKMLDIDELGLEASDRKILELIIHNYGGGPVGLGTIAAASGEEKLTIEDVYEPYLLQIGLLARTHKGRKATEKAYLHLGIKPPEQPKQESLL